MSTEKKVSYSSITSLAKCSYQFYLNRIENIPSKTHPKTIVGSLMHCILECLVNPRHKKHYDTIITTHGIVYERSDAIVRLIKKWQKKHNIKPELLVDINSMLDVALLKTDFFFSEAIKQFPPEQEFVIDIDGAKIKGIIDRMAEYPDYFLIRDYKSSAAKFTSSDLFNNIQARMYQWYIYKTYGKPAIVEFVFLRHAPTVRTPDKHLQVVKPVSPDGFPGFEFYIKHIYEVLNNFGLKEAYTSFCEDYGFCKNVCGYFKPFKYVAVKDKRTGKVIKNYMLDERYELLDNQYAEEIEFKGCVKHNRIS